MAKVTGLGGTALLRIEEAFDDTILERMERDDSEPSALDQQPLAGKQALD